MSESKDDATYARRLTECASLAELRDLMVLYSNLAIDAGRVVAAMTDDDFREFRRGLKSERKGRFAGVKWAERFGAVLMPLPMLTISRIAGEYGAPFNVTWKRLKELRPDLLEVPQSVGAVDPVGEQVTDGPRARKDSPSEQGR